jgi:hypothetical protein
MSPILGIWASGQQGAFTTAFDSIQTITVGSGGQSTISFTSIPTTYTHLQIRAMSRTNYASGTGGGIENYIRVGNGSVDTGSNYTIHELAGNGSTARAGAATSQTKSLLGYSPRNADLANTFGVYVCDILDYANTNKYKTFRSFAGHSMNGSADGDVELFSGLWMSTSAINTIEISTLAATNFTQYSTIALYGIK